MKGKASKLSTNFKTKKQATEEGDHRNDHRRPFETRNGKGEVRGGAERGNEQGEKGIKGLASQRKGRTGPRGENKINQWAMVPAEKQQENIVLIREGGESQAAAD